VLLYSHSLKEIFHSEKKLICPCRIEKLLIEDGIKTKTGTLGFPARSRDVAKGQSGNEVLTLW